MYFVKARKNFEDQDAQDLPEKGRRDRYQRSDSARLVLQATPTQQSKQADEGKSQFHRSDSSQSRGPGLGSEAESRPTEFRPEELPDGACYRPRKDLTNLPSTSASVASATAAASESKDITNPDTGLMEHVRPVEYIGTFSVSGSDKEVRERQMESQLEHMRNAQERRPVQLVISAAGVKVILPENNNIFMEHSLKRIWYATCDPEYCQFSFLAREPKTSAEVQYCHAFVTHTPEQAEELIGLIGEAFKSTYSEQQQQQQQQQQQKEKEKDQKETQLPKKQPTFHELIEQQVLQQQAKFREIEQEAQTALQQTLTQIATPTPFSERAQSRMEERRRQSEDLSLAMSTAAAARRDWAKHEIQWVKHAQQSPERSVNNNSVNNSNNSSSSNSPANNPNRRSEIPTRQSTPKTSPFKRNSVPPQVSLSSSQPHPLSALAIKESMESKAASKGSKGFKGSPVTALKNEIDRHLAMTNGEEPPPPPPTLGGQAEQPRHQQQQQQQQQQHPTNPMANRPLPLPPEESRSPQRSSRHQSPQHVLSSSSSSSPSTAATLLQQQQRRHHQQHPHPHLHQQRSLDDYHLPRSSTSPQVVSSSSKPPSSNGASGIPVGVRLRDSPRRRQPRPMSEIATSSSGLGGVRPGGSSYYEQQRQSLLSNFAASFSLQSHTEGEFTQPPPPVSAQQQQQQVLNPNPTRADGMYLYGPGPAPAPREAEAYSLASGVVGNGVRSNVAKRRSWAHEDSSMQQRQQQQQQQQQQLYQHHSPPSHHRHLQNGQGSLQQQPPQQRYSYAGESTLSSSSSSSPAMSSHHPSASLRPQQQHHHHHGSPQHHHHHHQQPNNNSNIQAPSSSSSSSTSHNNTSNNDFHQQNNNEPVVLRYQNDSQFVSASAAATKQGPG